MLTFFCYWNWNRKYDILFCGIMHNVQSMDISIRHPRLYTIYFISNYTLYKNAGFWLVNNRDFFFTNSGLALWICRIFTSCRCICIRFNFFSWYLQNRICRFHPSPRRLLQNLLNVISCAFYVTSFGRIKQIHHVRSWKRQTKGIIYLASVLNNIRCN
jgi:hypothetical protein